MWQMVEGLDLDEATTRSHALAFLEEYCRGMTLRDVREWYEEAVLNPS
jgi:hypothetical protein